MVESLTVVRTVVMHTCSMPTVDFTPESAPGSAVFHDVVNHCPASSLTLQGCRRIGSSSRRCWQVSPTGQWHAVRHFHGLGRQARGPLAHRRLGRGRETIHPPEVQPERGQRRHHRRGRGAARRTARRRFGRRAPHSFSVSPTSKPNTSRRPSADTPVAMTTAWDTTRRLTRAVQYVASKNTYRNAMSSNGRSRNAPTSSSRSAQMRDTSDLEIPESAPSAFTRSSTLRVETPCR